jgi:hypothetical protein
VINDRAATEKVMATIFLVFNKNFEARIWKYIVEIRVKTLKNTGN